MNSDNYAPRVAGLMYLVVFATYIGGMVLFDSAVGPDMGDTLTNMAAQPFEIRASVLLKLFSKLATVVLAVMLFATLKRVDFNLALLGLSFRLGEAFIAGIAEMSSLFLLSIGQAYTSTGAADPAFFHTLGSLFTQFDEWGYTTAATFFVVGNLAFYTLFFKARSIPRLFSVWSIIGSIIALVGYSLQALGVISAGTADLLAFPIIIEIPIGFWLLIKGAKNVQLQDSPPL